MPVPLQFSRYVGSPDRPRLPDRQKLHPGRVLPPSQPARAASDSERVTAIPTRYPPSVSTDRPGTGSDRIWVRSFANTGLGLRDSLIGSHIIAIIIHSFIIFPRFLALTSAKPK